MKKLVAITLFILFCLPAFSQIVKLKSSKFSYCYKDGSNWSTWSDKEETEVLIKLDLTNDKITIFSKETQYLDIAKYEDSYNDDDNNKVYPYYCLDNKGLGCYVLVVRSTDPTYMDKMIVTYSDIMFAYYIYKL